MQLEIRGAERLSFRERQVVTLKEMGYSSAKIAKQLGLNQSSVSTLLQRARSKGYEVVIVIPGGSMNIFSHEENDEEGEAVDEK
jgi:transposase